MDAALLTLFVKIIKHFFSSSEFLFFVYFLETSKQVGVQLRFYYTEVGSMKHLFLNIRFEMFVTVRR